MVVRIQSEGDCPVCGQPRVRAHGRQLQTCGQPRCAIELRARRVRGNAYGNRGGGPKATEAAGYSAVHARARRALRGMPCALDDASCKGRLEVALRPDAPTDLLRVDADGRAYFFGLQVTAGYRLLCRSHHGREGALQGAVRRDETVANALAVERLRSQHSKESCEPGCFLCRAFALYDEALNGLLHVHIVPRKFGDGLPLPWTPQQAAEDARAAHGRG